MSERLLLLTYAFPPMAVPEAILSAKQMGTLPSFEVDVVTVRPWKEWMGNDRSLESFVLDRFGSVRRIDAPSWLRRLPLRALGPLGRVPDGFRFVNRKLEREVGRLDLTVYAAVVTWSQWHSVHLVGAALTHGEPRVPWIAHMSDPWTDNPYVPAGPITKRINRKLEHQVLRSADALVFPARETAEHVLQRAPTGTRDRVAVVPHCWEPSLYGDGSERGDDRIVLRYLGHFYGPRTPEPIFAALAHLFDERPDLARRLQVELVGHMGPGMLRNEAYERVRDRVVLREPVPYAGALTLMSGADLLLVIDAPDSASPFLPSKVVDYLGARRAILAITPPGAAADVVRRLGGWVADPTDPRAIARALEEAVGEVERSRGRSFGDADVRDRYRSDVVAKEMEEVVRRAVERRSRSAGGTQ